MAPQVTVYTKDLCQPCKATKRWLDERNIPYEEKHGPDHVAELKELGDYMSAPVTVVTKADGTIEHWFGFHPDNLKQHAQAA